MYVCMYIQPILELAGWLKAAHCTGPFCGYLPAANALHELERDDEVGATNNAVMPVGTVASPQAPRARKPGEVSVYCC
jgi:hypothetical protein